MQSFVYLSEAPEFQPILSVYERYMYQAFTTLWRHPVTPIHAICMRMLLNATRTQQVTSIGVEWIIPLTSKW